MRHQTTVLFLGGPVERLLDAVVVDATVRPAGRMCAWVFAQTGAEVLRCPVEGNGPARRRAGGQPDPWGRLREEFWATGTRSAGVEDAAGLVDALRRADIVLAEPDFDWALVAEHASSGCLTGTVDPFGPDGPYATWHGTEIVYTSLGGATDFTHTPDGTPVYGFGHRYEYLAGWYLYVALAAGLGRCDAMPEIAHPQVRVSNLETVVSVLPYATTQYAYNGSSETVEQSGPRFVCACRDGYLVIYAGNKWPDMVGLLGDEELRDDERFVTVAQRFQHADQLGELFQSWCSDRTLAEAEQAAIEHSVAVARIVDVHQVLSDEQFSQRGAWAPREVAGLGQGVVPRLPFFVDGIRVPDPQGQV